MLGAMRDLWGQDKKLEAADIAKDAAPYMHPRLSNIDLKAEHESTTYVISGEPITDPEEWAKQFEEEVAGMVPPDRTPKAPN